MEKHEQLRFYDLATEITKEILKSKPEIILAHQSSLKPPKNNAEIIGNFMFDLAFKLHENLQENLEGK